MSTGRHNASLGLVVVALVVMAFLGGAHFGSSGGGSSSQQRQRAQPSTDGSDDGEANLSRRAPSPSDDEVPREEQAPVSDRSAPPPLSSSSQEQDTTPSLASASSSSWRAVLPSEWRWPASSRPPPAPAVFGIGANLGELTALRHEVEACELALAVIGNRFDSPRDVSKLKAFVMSAHAVREKYLVTHKDHMLDELRAWLTGEHNWTVIDFADEDLYFADMIAVEGQGAIPAKHKQSVKKLVGYALRMDLPRILSRKLPHFQQPGRSACDRHVLYMDTDIALELPRLDSDTSPINGMLQKGRPFLLSEMVDQYPTLAAVTTEYTMGWRSGIMPARGEQRVDSNTGIIVMNIPAMLATVRSFTRLLLQMVQEDDAEALSGTFDQTVYNLFYGAVTNGIVDKMFGWRLLSGLPPMARVLHFQGIKCESLLCDPPSGERSLLVDEDNMLQMMRINYSVPCSQTGVSWREHDTHFMSKAVGGLHNTRCAYEFACRRLFVDASTPWKCAKVAKRAQAHSTGFGFRIISVDAGRCGAAPSTCSLFSRGASSSRKRKRHVDNCDPSRTASLVPPVLRQEITPAMAERCSVAVAVLVDLRGAEAAERARHTVASAARSGVATVLAVVVGATHAAADEALGQLRRAAGEGTTVRGAALDAEGLQAMGLPGQDEAELAAGAAVVVPAALHSAGVLLDVAEQAAAYPCPSPVALVVEAGATVTGRPALSAGQLFPLYAALRVRCPGVSAVWPLGATGCFARGIPSLHSSRLALVNLLMVAGAARPALELARRLRSHGASSVDPLAAFVGTAALALPPGWGGPACRSPSTDSKDAPVVSLLPAGEGSSGCSCGSAKQASGDGGAWPLQPHTLQNPECDAARVCHSPATALAEASCAAVREYEAAGEC